MWCAAGDRCVLAYHGEPAWIPGPARLCPSCLDTSGQDVRKLVVDYVDLENVMADLGGQAEKVSGTREPGVNIALGAESLQKEIWHVVTTWEEILRHHCGFPELPSRQVRDGWAVQRAVTFIMPRLDSLAAVGPTATFPQGFDHKPEDVTGAEAILAMGRLHRRVGAALGLRRLTHALAAPCWVCCTTGSLRRDDGSEKVYCEICGVTSTWDEYQRSSIGLIDRTSRLVKPHGRKRHG